MPSCTPLVLQGGNVPALTACSHGSEGWPDDNRGVGNGDVAKLEEGLVNEDGLVNEGGLIASCATHARKAP